MSQQTEPAGARYAGIHDGIVALLHTARHAAARSVNALMTASYWEIGRRIVEFEQGGEIRAGYGQNLIERLAADLSGRFGRGFSVRSLEQMRMFYHLWPSERILQALQGKNTYAPIPQTLSAEFTPEPIPQTLSANSIPLSTLATAFPLPWSAYVRLLSVKNNLARDFYEAEALRCGWSVRQLDRQIDSQFYERTALSRDKAAMLQQAAQSHPSDELTPEQAIRDPFVLEFLNLKDQYSEADLEEALIHHLTDFLLELGDDFAFVGRQRRLRIDDSWFRVDLLFFSSSAQMPADHRLESGSFQLCGCWADAPVSELRP